MDKIPTGTWVVVADGKGARLFTSARDGQDLALTQVGQLTPTDLLDTGPSGVVPPESDSGYIDEATFAKQLANHLNAEAMKQAYDALVLVADPQTLGQLRPQLHKEVQSRLIGEVAKTLTNSPKEDIERLLG